AAAVLRGLAELLAPLAARNRSTAAAQRQGGTRVVDLLRASAAPGPGRDGAGSAAELGEALRSCGLPEQAAMTPVVARASGGPASWAAAALAEALQGTGAPFVVAPDPDRSAAEPGGATGLCAAPEAEVLAALERAWPRLRAVLAAPVPPRTEPRETEHGDQAERPELSAAVGPDVAPTLPTLRAALAQAEWILAAGPGPGPGATGTAGPAGGVAGSGSLGSLAALLRGVPAEVRAAYRERLLGPLLAHDRVNSVSLLHTLAVFLDLDGSWSRAAQALHVHVNTVHYRVRRIEELTGRNLSRLEDRTDLRAALLCESAPS
ncbi:PucR family transcriptional regulator, partial [Streptacidiphilus jiangxiensis]